MISEIKILVQAGQVNLSSQLLSYMSDIRMRIFLIYRCLWNKIRHMVSKCTYKSNGINAIEMRKLFLNFTVSCKQKSKLNNLLAFKRSRLQIKLMLALMTMLGKKELGAKHHSSYSSQVTYPIIVEKVKAEVKQSLLTLPDNFIEEIL